SGPHAAARRPARGHPRQRARPGRPGRPGPGLDGAGRGRADPLRHPPPPALRGADAAGPTRSTSWRDALMTRLIVAIAGLAALALTACEVHVGRVDVVRGSGNVKSESRDVRDFDRVGVSGVGTLTITQGSTESLTIQAEDNLLPLLRS